MVILCFRWSRCPKEDQAVNTSWLVPCAWLPQNSWAVAGALECARGRASATIAGETSPAHLGSPEWDNPQSLNLKSTTYDSIHFQWWTIHCLLLTQFFPRTAPPDGQTELTLTGWEFQSPLRPAITSRTHQIRLGQTSCTVIPAKSNNTQWVTLQGLFWFQEQGFCVIIIISKSISSFFLISLLHCDMPYLY